MADSLDVAVVRILHESAVVVRVIFGSQAGLAIILAASRHCGVIECPHSSPVLRREGDVHRSARLALGQPQAWRAFGTETYQSVALVLQGEPQWSQGGGVEAL